MKTTVEISVNPLTEDYETVVTEFILQLKQYKEIETDVHGLSTHIYGEYHIVMGILQKEMEACMMDHNVIIHLKMGKGELKKANLPGSLQ